MQTWGSHGDIRPFLALAEGLQAAGNDVHLVITCIDSNVYDSVVSEHGVRITVLAPLALDAARQAEIGRTVYNVRDPMKQMGTILRLCFAPAEDDMFAAAQRLGAESDLLIGHYFMHPLQIAAERAGRPYVSVLLSHVAIPSDFNHPIRVPGFGKTGNRLLWWLTRKLINRTLLHYPNRIRKLLGMPLTRDITSEVWLSDYLTLAAVSPQICEAQADWPASVHVCGFLDTPNLDMEGVVPPTLAAFLAAGDAPVYMTFGSWMPKDVAGQTANLRLLTDAANVAGCRAIIQSQSAEECGFTSDERMLYIPTAPHHAIFPHCRAVVHHGGAGTTQSVALAGKPSVVVAHISEQEHWGNELRRIGVAGKPIQRRKATPAALAKQIERLRDQPEMTVKAQALASAMRKENGVAEAVRLITQRANQPLR